jgi:N-acetylglucosaminyl-diphospho-decaprenol L-rhamnosyltransferase
MSNSAHGRGTVGVVVVHFGDAAPTAECVRALREDTSSCARRVVVVDNSGTLRPDALPGAEVLNAGGNLGFGTGANVGVRHLGAGPWGALVVLNHDVEVADGYLDAALEALAEDGVGAAAGPLYLDRPGGALWYAGGSVCFLTGTVRQSTSAKLARRARTVGFFPGAAIAIRQQAWNEVGGFDPGYFLYNEDVDLCLRLRRRGYRLGFAPRMVAVHQLGAVTGSAGRSPFYLELMAKTRLRPFRPLLYRIYLAGLHSGYVLLRSLWLLAAGGAGREAARALLRGHATALAGLGRGPLP